MYFVERSINTLYFYLGGSTIGGSTVAPHIMIIEVYNQQKCAYNAVNFVKTCANTTCQSRVTSSSFERAQPAHPLNPRPHAAIRES